MIHLNTNPHIFWTLVLVALVNFAVGTWVFLKQPRHAVNQSFFAFVAGISLWITGFTLLGHTKEFFFDKIINYGGLLVTCGLFIFAQVFPEKHWLPVSKWLLLAPFAIWAVGIIPWNFINAGMIVNAHGDIIPVPGPLLAAHGIMLFGYIVTSFILLLRNFRNASNRQKNQFVYLFLGMGVFLLFALVFDVLLPALGVNSFNLLGPLASIVFVISTAYAIVRHQLMDIRLVIQRGVIYSILLTITIGLYVLGTIAALNLFERSTSVALMTNAGLVSLLGIFGAPHLEKYFRKLTDPWFFKDGYDYASALQELSNSLTHHLDLHLLIRDTTAILKKIFKVSRVNFLILEPMRFFRNGSPQPPYDPPLFRAVVAALEQQAALVTQEKISEQLERENLTPKDRDDLKLLRQTLASSELALILKMGIREKIVGYISMDHKISGDDFTAQDFQLLATFANQAAVTLEKSRLYAEVKNYSAELEQRVKDRTAQLEQFQEAERQMMVDVSHSLQTPLTIMKSGLGLLQKSVPHDEDIKALEKTVDEISKRIYDLMRLVRLETQEEKFAFERLDFSALAEEVAEYVSVMCTAQGICLTCQVEPSVYVRGDKRKLEEMINNLISNSVKYIANERTISLSLTASEGMAEFAVKDSGIGIPPHSLPNLFKRFYRTDLSRQTAGGMGVGLAICKKIAEKHGGDIHVSSQVGKGTTFTVHLPLD